MHLEAKPGRYVQVTVSDTGVGIPAEVVSRIFEPFFTTKEVGKGTGLGLAIAYGVVKQHKGAISVASEPGHGATFTFVLPLLHSAVQLDAETHPDAAAGGTELVLVAEDDPAVRRMLGRVLRGAGYEVIEAADGEDAVRRFREHRERVRLVILDVVMPRRNGREALDDIRELEPSTRALFMSGHQDDPSGNPIALGDDVLVPKPVHPTELLRVVREVLDGLS
jgi:CheY-like chemotaxis protein